MKQIMFILSILFMVSCGGNATKTTEDAVVAIDSAAIKAAEALTDGAHNAQNSLDVEGVYIGKFPMGSKGVKTVIINLKGNKYTRLVTLPAVKMLPLPEEGSFKWNAEGNTITLEGTTDELASQYFVGENKLIQLDKEGKKMEGADAAQYVLIKQ